MNKNLKQIIGVMIGGVIITALIIFGGIAGYFITEEFDLYNKVTFTNKEGIKNLEQTNLTEIINGCDNLIRIDKKLDCVRNHVQRFFHYKITDDSKDMSFKELMENGGDCRNWSQFWDYIAGEMGLSKDSIKIGAGNSTAHRFSIFYNYQGYCLVDQLRLECVIYG